MAPYRTYAMAFSNSERSHSGRAVLGHARPLSLCAAAAGRWSHRFSHRRRRRPQERRSRRCGGALSGARSLDAQSHPSARKTSPIAGRDRCSTPSIMPASSAAIPEQEHLCAYRRFRPGHDARRCRRHDQFGADPRTKTPDGPTSMTLAQDAAGDRQFPERERDRGEELCRVSRAGRTWLTSAS